MRKHFIIIFLLAPVLAFCQVEIGPHGGVKPLSGGTYSPIEPTVKIEVSGIKSNDSIVSVGNISLGAPVYTIRDSSTYSFGAVPANQSYAWDGTNHYLCSSDAIYKLNSSWSVTASNTSALTGLTGVNHMGDGVYYNGLLYLPVESYAATCIFSAQKIAVFDATTLALQNQYDISANKHEVSAIGIKGDTLIITSFCNPDYFYLYSLTGTLIDSVHLSLPISGIQGVSFYNNKYYIGNETAVYSCERDGSNVVQLATSPYTNNLGDTHVGEGLENVNGQIRWLNFPASLGFVSKVYYLTLDNSTYNKVSTITQSGELSMKNGVFVGTQAYSRGAITLNTSPFKKIGLLNPGVLTENYVVSDASSGGMTFNSVFDNGWKRFDTTRPSFALLAHFLNKRLEIRTSEKSTSKVVTWKTPFTLSETGNATLSATPTATANNQVTALLNLNAVDFLAAPYTNVTHTILNLETSIGNQMIRLSNTGPGGKAYFITSSNSLNASGGGKFLVNNKNSTADAILRVDSLQTEIYNAESIVSNDDSAATLTIRGDRSNIGDVGAIDERLRFRHDIGLDGVDFNVKNFSLANQMLIDNMVAGDTTHLLSFGNGTTTGVRNTGLYTTNPLESFHMVKDAITGNYFRTDCANGAPGFQTYRLNGTLTSPTAVASGDIIGLWGMRGYNGSAYTTFSSSYIVAKAAQDWTTSANGTFVAIGTTPVGSTTSADRVTINSAGNVGVGTTAPTSLIHVFKSAANAKLEVQTTTTPSTSDEANIILKSGDDSTIIYYRDNDNNFGIYHGIAGVNATKFRLGPNGMSLMETGGAVGIGTLSPNASSVFDATSTTKGVLFPRMTTTQRNAITSPATGLTLYCTDCTATDASTGVMQTYNGTVWKNNW